MEPIGMKRICLLGASGSIGRQTLDIIEAFPDQFQLVAFSIGERIHLLPGILAKHPHVKHITVKYEAMIAPIYANYPGISFYHGEAGLLQLIDASKATLVVNALVGFVGLEPTLFTLNKGIDVALANKEALVVGGSLVNKAKQAGHADLIPIDSEHVALDKLLRSVNKKDVARIVLTASGGSLYRYARSQLNTITPAQALAHPTWDMGPKITIDSATMMNKGFEVIEAHHLFHLPNDKIEVVIHPTSKVHSLIQLVDGTYLADIGINNMHIPISYALFRRRRVLLPFIKQEPSIVKLAPFEFKEIDADRFPALTLARWALDVGGTLPAVLNGANEIAVSAFLAGKLRFDLIEQVIQTAMEAHNVNKHPTYNDLKTADGYARAKAEAIIKELSK